jgi:cytochrome c oxidase subunit 4
MKPTPVRTYLLTWVALLAALALTCGSAYVHLGSFNLVLNLLFAGIKAVLVMLLFMHLRRSSRLIRMVAVAGFFWLSLLAVLSTADFITQP